MPRYKVCQKFTNKQYYISVRGYNGQPCDSRDILIFHVCSIQIFLKKIITLPFVHTITSYDILQNSNDKQQSFPAKKITFKTLRSYVFYSRFSIHCAPARAFLLQSSYSLGLRANNKCGAFLRYVLQNGHPRVLLLAILVPCIRE